MSNDPLEYGEAVVPLRSKLGKALVELMRGPSFYIVTHNGEFLPKTLRIDKGASIKTVAARPKLWRELKQEGYECVPVTLERILANG